MNLLNRVQKIKGTTGIYFKDLISGELMAYNAGGVFPSASIIGLPLFMAVCKMVNEGRASFEEKIKVTHEMRVHGAGALSVFTDEPVVDVATLCDLMVTTGDRTAENVLLEHFTPPVFNEEFKAMGLTVTQLDRVVPKEIGGLLEQLYQGTFVDREVSEKILNVLCRQQCRNKIPAHIRKHCKVASHSGASAAEGITGDAAVVLGEHPFILVALCNETSVADTDEWISHLGRDLFEERKKAK